MTAVQSGSTSIRVLWTPPTPLGDTTGYIIYYTNDDNTDSGSVDIDDDSTELMNLQNGVTYTISIVATSQHLPSGNVPANATVNLSELTLAFMCS